MTEKKQADKLTGSDAIAKTLRMGDMRAQRAEWLGNIRQNLGAIFRGKDIAALSGALRGLPGIIAGAGPSLEKNIGTLADNSRKYPIFCCDRAWRRLHDAGVKPTFIVAVDWQDAVADFFDGLPSADTVLIASVKISPKVLALPWKRVVFFITTDADKKFVEAEINLTQGRVTSLPGALVCGNTAYLLARHCGCSPVTFAGCDMSMPEPPEDPSIPCFEATGIGGEKIYSLPGYLAGYEWLLRRLRVDKDVVSGKVKVYNSTEGGIMYADVLPAMTLREFVAAWPGAGGSINTKVIQALG